MGAAVEDETGRDFRTRRLTVLKYGTKCGREKAIAALPSWSMREKQSW